MEDTLVTKDCQLGDSKWCQRQVLLYGIKNRRMAAMCIPMKGKVVMAGIISVISRFTVHIKIIIPQELQKRAVVAFPVFRIMFHQIRNL